MLKYLTVDCPKLSAAFLSLGDNLQKRPSKKNPKKLTFEEMRAQISSYMARSIAQSLDNYILSQLNGKRNKYGK